MRVLPANSPADIPPTRFADPLPALLWPHTRPATRPLHRVAVTRSGSDDDLSESSRNRSPSPVYLEYPQVPFVRFACSTSFCTEHAWKRESSRDPWSLTQQNAFIIGHSTKWGLRLLTIALHTPLHRSKRLNTTAGFKQEDVCFHCANIHGGLRLGFQIRVILSLTTRSSSTESFGMHDIPTSG